MVRETRHLWVGNLPDNIREDRIREHFKRYGRVQSVKLLPRSTKEETGENAMACTVAFMDIKSASKAHTAEHKIDDRTLTTEYYEPAAIPSAASPQNTPSSYSTSPGSTRFPNGHGSTEEHGNFNDRFYERTNSRVAEGEFIRRTGYHDNGRGRNRDRGYRNGPYNSVIDRTHRTLNNSWTYDATRYNSQTNETGYTSAPSETNERRSSDIQSTKKKKSRSGSRSPSPSGSTSSRSPSRSRSRSSSSSSSSTTSRATSSTSSPKSRRLASSINATHQPVVHSEDRRPLAICVRNLPLRSSDTSLKDGLFHEYKKHGKVTWVKVVGQSSDRQAIVCFKKPEDVEKALEVSYDKLFFGCKIEVAPYQGYDVVEDNDLRPYEADIDEFHPKATRTLFIGNLEKDVTASDLRKHFDQFGEIIEIDIKKQGAVGSYAFCQFSDIVSVVKAIRTMDGEHLGNNRVKLGFGKSMPTNCVWVDGIVESVNEKYLIVQFDPYGSITQVNIDREKGQALIFYEQLVNAQAAVIKMRGATLRGRKIQVDFASRECQEAFFEHLEKQGHVLERPGFEERRDSATRNFDTATLNSANRFSRYETPTRPRTSSYSSRSSAATTACNANAIPSPGTPGSGTPRGAGSRSSRMARFTEYYDQISSSEFCDRHFRSYDEYSQGSAASHEDGYEHDYSYNHDSPSHVETIESRTMQSVTNDHNVVPFAPPDIRNLQKERVHLLEQLEECPSSGDELISPKKRLKLEHMDSTITSDVIIEANRDHRKVMEVRRLSDAGLKHHSRRPSVDSKHSRDVPHERGSYLPHAVCKRRKTAGSDSGSRVHHYDHSGSESVGGSRPGTPLCDERPEHFTPTEPRRIPREREGPLTLPLPRFAAQVMNRGSVSVAGIKGQKENVLSSPPPAVTSPRISNPKPPSPAQVPPPASPPPRPPSLSSNSSDSDIAPPSPSLDERIKSLEEKYEKWSGSRALSAAGGDALAKLDATREKFRFRHKLLDLDLKEVQPSEIVKSVMAKRSVFDEDSKRLENVGEKYEPRDFNFFPRASTTAVQTSVPATPLSAPPLLKVPPATQLLSPRSTVSGTASMIPAKGLQYPFPSHPPVQPPPPTTPSTPTTPLLTTATASTTNRGSHGDSRLKPCVSAPSDNRTPSKVTVNRSVTSSVVVSNLTQIKTSDNNNSKSSVNNIPANSSDPTSTTHNVVNASATDANSKQCKGVRDAKTGDRVSEKVSGRRDSVSNNGSPKSEIKSRRNSDSTCRKGDESDKQSESSDSNLSEYKKDRAKSEERRKEQKFDSERLEKERLEKERLEKEKQERERLEKERIEREKLEREKEERERLEKERLERERLERERKREREERERKEREEKEKKEREEREKREREEQLERERVEKERKERKEREERERKEREEKERREKDEKERERREREERERREREEREKERREKEEKERERREREERERREKEEKEKRDKEEEERLEKERTEKERKREKDEDRRHKDDNHEKRKDDHSRHRETHSENKHRENNIDSNRNDKHNTKENREDKVKDNHELSRKDSHESRNSHESSRDSKSRHHFDRDTEKRKEASKDSSRENNIHDKTKNIANDARDINKDRLVVESRHLSIDLDKNRQYDLNTSKNSEPIRRKERNNSLPTNIGNKRRVSSHESLDNTDDSKRMKLSQEHRKLSERRDSKDSRSDDKSKSKHKNSTSKTLDEKGRLEKSSSEEKRKEKDRDKEERHKNKLHKFDKQKLKSKSRDKESPRESPSTPKSPAKELTDKDFLARLDLRATDDIEKQKQQRKEMKEKRKQDSLDSDERKECSKEDSKKAEERKKDKHSTSDKKIRDDLQSKNSEERKALKKERIRKITQNSSDNTDSDEPKKHSIFDIVDDEPAYISMYDKVKARSCKNMQKQEEEKRQEKIKAKFSQLKQSRAKREEKKRSTSWDEDSDSDRERLDKQDIKSKRGNKMLIASSDEEELGNRKSRKKHDIYTDSDSDKHRQIKSEQTETSDDDRIRNKNMQRKGSKSRIASDTSDDDFKRLQSKIKSEIFSDNEVDQNFTDCSDKLFKKVKEEYDDKFIKKERKSSKHLDSLEQINAQIFGDSNSPISDIKIEKYNNRHSFVENSSGDENTDIKKEKSEARKKHKKKQKRQKNSVSSEDSCKLESIVDLIQSDDKNKHEKKKQHTKKDKKKDKNKDEDKIRDKSKKSRKSKSESKADIRRDGKIENIFGSLSEDSDGAKETENVDHVPKQNSFLEHFNDDNVQVSSMYVSDCDSISHEKEVYKSDETKESYKSEDKELFKTDEKQRSMKEEHRKRKEKKRREKERRLREELINESSMDYADMGKQLEANIKDDSVEEATEEVKIKTEVIDSIVDSTQDSFRFLDGNESQEIKKEEQKESKERKKKRKKSKEEKQNRHHHHHRHDKNKLKSPEFKRENSQSVEEVKVETTPEEKPDQSLPNLLDLPSPPLNNNKSSPNLDYSVSPVSREPLISPIPKTPSSSKEKKREKFIPGFGSEIDEKIHESAIKSISSEFDTPKTEVKPTVEESLKPEKVNENVDEKPRVVISQEETEDAVAALLGESFGGEHFEDPYNDEEINQSSEQVSTMPEENIPQDDEEMRQAVQSLNSGDMEIKPDTPQSEHELQIDTDTEEQEELSSRYDQPPRTPDMIDLSKPPKTPDIPNYYRNEEQTKATTVLIKTTSNLGSPPSLTPLKPQNAAILEAKKNLEKTTEPPKTNSLSIPVLPEQTRTVISQPWSLSDKKETVLPKLEPPVITVEDKITPSSIQTSVVAMVSQAQTKINITSPRTYSTSPVVKMTEPAFPPLTIIAKQELASSPKPDLSPKLTNLQTSAKSPSPSLMHNLPARPPYQVPMQQKQTTPTCQESGVNTRVSTPNFSLNRLPITPVMVSKPLQPTTVVLPQPKTAHNIEPPKLVPTTEMRQERPKIVCHTTAITGYVQTQPRMVVQTSIPIQRSLPPQGLLVPAKQLPSNNYNYLSQPNFSSVVKEAPASADKIRVTVSESMKILPTSVPITYSHTVAITSTVPAQTTQAPSHKIIISHSTTQPQTTAVNAVKPFMPVIQETPKLISISSSNADVQKCVIYQASAIKTSSTVQPQQPPTTKESSTDSVQSKTEKIEQDTLKVQKNTSRTSTPSPVIVSTPREIKPEAQILPAEIPPSIEEKDAKPLPVETTTEELNVALKKENEEKVEIKPQEEVCTEIQEVKPPTPQPQPVEIKPKVEVKEENDAPPKVENENVSVIKETEKFDEEKADTDSVVSDISKERSSAEILTKDDPLDSKEDSDYWSAKEVNIDSVIKKVDALCSGDEMSDRSSEVGKDEWLDNETKAESDVKSDEKTEHPPEKVEEPSSPNSTKNEDGCELDIDNAEEKEVATRGRRGRGTRGRKTRGVDRTGVQTRRTKVTTTPAKRGGRGGRPKNERKISKSESETSADIYEFRDDSDENNVNKDRPRLILTIKSPAIVGNTSGNGQTAVVKEVIKENTSPQPTKPVENKEEFISPVANTRKSRRLQERDVSRNTVDDTIEDVVRNTAIVTRSATGAIPNQTSTPRRSARQTATKIQLDTPRKSPRGGRKKDRRSSETNDDSSEEKSLKNETIIKSADSPKEPEKPKMEEEKVEAIKEKPHEGLKAAVLRRVKGEMHQEPMTLIDPVTGLLTPMRECEEGRYIPVPGAPNANSEVRPNAQPQVQIKTNEPQPQQQQPPPQQQQSVITTSQQNTVPKQPKPQSLKAHVLSSQAAKAVTAQQQAKSMPVCQPTQQSVYVSKSSVPINQNLNVNVSLPNYVPAHLSPRTSVPLNITKTMPSVKSQQPPPVSPNQIITLTNQQKQQILQQAQVINTQLAHVNNHQQPPMMKQQVVINKNQLQIKNPLHAQQQILTGAVASPPLKQGHPSQPSTSARIVQGPPAGNKGAMEPPKVENSLASCVLVPRPNVSPQGQPRHVLQAGIPVPAYEASLHGERSLYNRSRSPPPAHQNSPSPQGEAMAHFPPGSVPLRHDLPPAHYMHQQHVMYQQFLRQSYHLQPRSLSGGLEKSGDGQEGEEAPVTSPPLELRRPGSVGLALTGRSTGVPHSLQSPHDRATDSPQVGQVYNMRSARMQHYHPGRYYEQTAEPPPAHRPLTSHGSLTALASDRPLSHMVPLGTPDRPLSSHMTPDRPLSTHSALASHISGLGTQDRPISTHLPPDRSLSSHSLGLGAGLGAAGNLMGAAARHIAADAPTSQRGIQAATPPHASQVPPQAESLLMLLKQYPCMWQGLLALKNDQAAVQMYFVSGNDAVAKCSLPKNTDGSTPPLRIFQRMRLEPPQVEGVARKMQMENEHCMLLALPCGHDHMDVLKQSTNLTNGFITYLQQKQAAGIVNVAAPGTTQPPAYVVHIFPSCDFVNENLRRIAPSLLERVADIAHLLIVITTV